VRARRFERLALPKATQQRQEKKRGVLRGRFDELGGMRAQERSASLAKYWPEKTQS
jgi:hypothetical protein